MPTRTIDTENLIIGSGPIGCTFGRFLVEAGQHVTMVEAGAQHSIRRGEHLKNAYVYQRNLDAFTSIIQGLLQTLSIPTRDTESTTMLDPVSFRPRRRDRGAQNPAQVPALNLAAAAASYGVGGMFTHWTNNTPRPWGSERVKMLNESELNALLAKAETVLKTHPDLYAKSVRHQVLLKWLCRQLAGLPSGRGPQPLPVAGEPVPGHKNMFRFTGSDTVLDHLAEGENPKFSLKAQHRARKLHWHHDRVTSVSVEDLTSGEDIEITADRVVVCAGSILTPQLLWCSGIAPPALGRYLTEHPIAFCQVVLSDELVTQIADFRRESENVSVDDGEVPIPHDDPPPMIWIPFSEERPWHCQVHRDSFSFGALPPDIDDRLVVDLRWFGRVEPNPENRVTFETEYKDRFGMPQPTFEFRLSEQDRKWAHKMMADMTQVAHLIGGFLPGAEPRFMPPGTSLHFLGTYRMGNDGNERTSVVDTYSRVWGFENLFLGGNGVIPTSTACNPTLSSVAFALRAVTGITGVDIPNLAAEPAGGS